MLAWLICSFVLSLVANELSRVNARSPGFQVPYIAEHIRNLAQSFDSKIPGAENLLVRQLGRYLFYSRDE